MTESTSHVSVTALSFNQLLATSDWPLVLDSCLNKCNHESGPDSLKMDWIYASETWGGMQAELHQQEMLIALREHYAKSFDQQSVEP